VNLEKKKEKEMVAMRKWMETETEEMWRSFPRFF